jgi:hypothetical protein
LAGRPLCYQHPEGNACLHARRYTKSREIGLTELVLPLASGMRSANPCRA